MKKNIKLLLSASLVLAGIALYFWYFEVKINNSTSQEFKQAKAVAPIEIKTDRYKKIDINDNDTYGVLMAQAGLDYTVMNAIYKAAEPIYDLAKIRCGRCLDLVYDKDTDQLKKLIYKIDSEDELHVSKISTSTPLSENTASTAGLATSSVKELWLADIRPIPYEVKTKISAGTIESSMYQAALDNDIDIRAIIELANAFQWTIDFAMDPRVGDTFKFIYEERYLNDEYIMPGQILAGIYINDGQAYEVYYFKESDDNQGFFDKNGNSVQKMFLKAPVAFKYISSGFSTGPRYVGGQYQVFTSSHRAIDYAAPIGTPIRAVGNGTIIFTGWKSGYGNFTSIRHNETYTTNYAHQSKISVNYGQKVTQGEVIGYVGSTGFSTGPHLHFEMVKNGIKINPLREILPPGKPIKDENKERFFAEIKKWEEKLSK